ncbi:MarR family winged helix-turn-helix transcriptional regulator [Rhodovibrio salinarum]|nr:MarR family transcriptional regulator [Rhodovibrio salinarum]
MASDQKTNGQQWSDFGRLLPAVGQAWRRILGQRIAEEGLSDATALPILELLRAGDKLMRQRELAQRLGLENSTVVWIIDALQKKELLQRREDPSDRRAKLLELTEEGRELGLRVDRIAVALREELLRDVAPADIEATHRLLLQMSAALEDCQSRTKRG